MPVTAPDLMVGAGSGDDAAVWRLGGGRVLIQTLDFFTPVVDDAYTFGQIAAANAISDIYAMGATPLFALNIVAFPLKTLGHDVLREILRGGGDKAREAGIPVAGGHSIDDAEPKYGMVVTGECMESELLTNSAANPGDVVVLTKPIGVGIMTTAVKQCRATEADIAAAVKSMAALNKPGAEAARAVGAKCATDITGFGLLGHLGGIARESNVTIELDYAAIPVFPQAVEFVKAGIAPGGTRKNLAFFGQSQLAASASGAAPTGSAAHFTGGPSVTTEWRGDWQDWQKLLVADAQTCGGMAICVPAAKADALIRELKSRNALAAAVIGRVTPRGQTTLVVRM
jgi:selenide,water dikinase